MRLQAASLKQALATVVKQAVHGTAGDAQAVAEEWQVLAARRRLGSLYQEARHSKAHSHGS